MEREMRLEIEELEERIAPACAFSVRGGVTGLSLPAQAGPGLEIAAGVDASPLIVNCT